MSATPSTLAAARLDVRRLALLAGMMFTQHAVLSAFSPTLPLRLSELGIPPERAAHVFGAMSIVTAIAPWIGGHLADRVLPAQFVLALANAIGAIVLWLAADETRYWPLLALLCAQSLVFMPAFAICNHVVLRNLRTGVRNFGYVRMWGTAGWVVGSLIFGLWLSRPAWLPFAAQAGLADGLRIGAIFSICAGLYCLLLPNTPPETDDAPRLAAAQALRMLREPDIAALMAASLLISLSAPFFYPTGNFFLKSLGVTDAAMGPLLATGQAVEVFVFLGLATILQRFGYRWTLLLGVATWTVRLAIWVVGGPWPAVVGAVAAHGICYAFIYGLGQMYLDHRAPRDAKATVQSMHLVLISGVGIWPGNWLASELRTRLSTGGVTQWAGVFLVPTVLGLAAFLILLRWFRDPRREVTRSEPVSQDAYPAAETA